MSWYSGERYSSSFKFDVRRVRRPRGPFSGQGCLINWSPFWSWGNLHFSVALTKRSGWPNIVSSHTKNGLKAQKRRGEADVGISQLPAGLFTIVGDVLSTTSLQMKTLDATSRLWRFRFWKVVSMSDHRSKRLGLASQGAPYLYY